MSLCYIYRYYQEPSSSHVQYITTKFIILIRYQQLKKANKTQRSNHNKQQVSQRNTTTKTISKAQSITSGHILSHVSRHEFSWLSLLPHYAETLLSKRICITCIIQRSKPQITCSPNLKSQINCIA